MRIGFIALSGLRVYNPELAALGLTLPGFIERKEVIASLPSLGLLTLAALTPNDIEVEYIELDDFTPGSSLPAEFDVVAISSFTAQIYAAYRLADSYRNHGAQVILGGLHVTALPEEALDHADAVLLGEGEALWGHLIADIRNNRLNKVYDARLVEYSFEESPLPRYELLDIDRYNRVTVQTQRGCPFRCEFCASSILLSKKYKRKPIQRIVREIKQIKQFWDRPFIELADDNTFVSKKHSRELVKALSREAVKWFTETDISVARDSDLVSMLADSGCRQLLIGLESPISSGLQGLELKSNWKERQLDFYKEAIYRIQSKGISVNGCFVLGLDGHDASIFDKTLSFVEESELSEVQITIQTPFPGTELYQRLKNENRLLEQVFWDKCTLFDVTYQPRNMSVAELENGFRDLMKSLYSDDLVHRRKHQFAQLARRNRSGFGAVS
jgi:radical SAM superfamily enzyme YgiQ (UPF0313 family)